MRAHGFVCIKDIPNLNEDAGGYPNNRPTKRRSPNVSPALTLQPPNYSFYIFTHFNLCLADAIHTFKWVTLFRFDKMEVNDFEILSRFIFNMLKIWYLLW